MEPTGKAMVFTGVNLDRVTGGKIVDHRGAANLFASLIEAGAIERTQPTSDG